MHKTNSHCNDLLETTAAALHEDRVGLMLLGIQKGNLKLSVKRALTR